MAGQGKTRPGLLDPTKDCRALTRALDTMIDEQRERGLDRIDIYMSREKRAALLREIAQTTLLIYPTQKPDEPQVETYRGCRIIVSDVCEPSIYVVAQAD